MGPTSAASHYPPSLKWAVDDAHLTKDPHYVQSIMEYRCSPIRLLEYINREYRARDALDLYDLSEGYTKTVRLHSGCGFVANAKNGVAATPMPEPEDIPPSDKA